MARIIDTLTAFSVVNHMTEKEPGTRGLALS